MLAHGERAWFVFFADGESLLLLGGYDDEGETCVQLETAILNRG